MKYLKTYEKIFESNGTINEYYFDALDILQNLFDDFNIIPLPKEGENGLLDELLDSNNSKYWAFRTYDISGKRRFTSDIDSIISPIDILIIYNINELDLAKFNLDLKEEVERVKRATGKDVIVNYQNQGVMVDITIQIEVSPDEIYNDILGSIDFSSFDSLEDTQKREVIKLVRKLRYYL